MKKVLLSCKGISKRFNSSPPLFSDLSLDLYSGEKVAICGRSGSGKTTLLHILATLDTPSSGIITFSEELPFSPALRNIGFVFQSFHLLEESTVLENVLLPVSIARLPHAVFLPKAEELLHQMGVGHLVHQKVSYLSGGEKQRVALARALILDPQFIFADEPTGNLDFETAKSIKELLLKIVDETQKTLLLVTHDRPFSQSCDKVFELNNAKLSVIN